MAGDAVDPYTHGDDINDQRFVVYCRLLCCHKRRRTLFKATDVTLKAYLLVRGVKLYLTY